MSESTVKTTQPRTEVIDFTMAEDGSDASASERLTELIHSARRAIADAARAERRLRSFDMQAEPQVIAEHLESSRKFLEKATAALDACGWSLRQEEGA